jgi:hypothetical protein
LVTSTHIPAVPHRTAGRRTVTEDNARTTVHFTLDLKPTGLMRVLDGLITRSMPSEEAPLSILTSAVEAG